MIPGNCSCGKVHLSLYLPDKLNSFAPRVCDCDFCMERSLAYLSHPDGKLIIQSNKKLQPLKQGSEQATFLACYNCHDIVVAVYKFGNLTKGAINATLLKNFQQMKEPRVVSPKLLSAKEKIARWNSLWLTVEINSEQKVV